MPTTFSDLSPVRRVAVGDCDGPLGSGFDALARSAYAALLAASWTEDGSAPFLPVHDNGQTANKTIPHGDAWKCSYGYDAAARTERSACGAVCYTFALPADATAGTPANISTVALAVTGDRYLDAGVDVYVLPSASATPPSVAELLAETPVGTFCATSGQAPVKPNERHGVTAAVSWEPTATPAQPYLHVALLLHDYTNNRGAWIEGGAMLEGAAASIAFSRDVAADTAPGVPILRVTGTPPTGSTNERTVVVGYYALKYYVLGYQYGSEGPSDADYAAVLPEILRVAASGGIPTNSDETKFMAYASVGGYPSIAFWDNSSFYGLSIPATAYFAPAARILGLDVSFPFYQVEDNTAGAFRIALVQSSSATPESIAGIVAAAARGEGSDVVGYADLSLPAVAARTRRVAEIRILREPDKPYLLAVLIPLTMGGSIALAYSTNAFDDAILFATSPSA